MFSNILAVRTSTEVSSIPRILLKEISIVYLDFLSFPVGSCWTDNFSFGYFTRLGVLAGPMCIVYKCCYVKIMCVFISTFIDVIKLYK